MKWLLTIAVMAIGGFLVLGVHSLILDLVAGVIVALVISRLEDSQ